MDEIYSTRLALEKETTSSEYLESPMKITASNAFKILPIRFIMFYNIMTKLSELILQLFSLQITLPLIINLHLFIMKSFVRIRRILAEITRHVASCLTIWATVAVLDQMLFVVLTVKISYHCELK